MKETAILKRNLLALSTKNAALSFKTGRAEFAENCRIIKSRTGTPVPVLRLNGREYPLHSTFNPLKEGINFYKSFSTGGYLVFLGFGAGYHILPFLERDDISGILIIDKDISLFKAVLNQIDLRSFILDPRVNFLIDTGPDEINQYLLSNYFPAVTGDLQTLSLRSRIQSDNKYFTLSVESIKKAISTLSDDYTVQSYFGKKWFSNTVSNLKTAQRSTITLKPVKEALITGAGPSLEIQLEELEERHKTGFLIATDTSLPVLTKNGITPDVVISIDCQHITYHHFLSGFPDDIPLVMDLASPAGLTAITENSVFFTSGHPFSLYVNSHWRRFPLIDISGGNVSHAAVSLADKLGAQKIYLFGTDFSYPEGKTYSRGSYIYPYFTSKSGKINSIESLFFNFLMRNSRIVKEKTGDTIRYTTRPMISYKERLEHAAAKLNGTVIPVKGRGVPLLINSGKKRTLHDNKIVGRVFSAGPPSGNWRSFLLDYDNGLSKLPRPKKSLSSYFEKLSTAEKDLCTTLFPASASFRKEFDGSQIIGAEILSNTLSWTREIIKHAVSVKGSK